MTGLSSREKDWVEFCNGDGARTSGTDKLLAVLELDGRGISDNSAKLLDETNRIARGTSGQVCAAVAGLGSNNIQKVAKECPTDILFAGLVETNSLVDEEMLLAFLCGTHNELKPSLTLFPSTLTSHPLAARLAARLNLHFLASCIDFEVDTSTIKVRRPVYQNVAHSTVSVPRTTQLVATVDCSVLSKPSETGRGAREVKVTELVSGYNRRARVVSNSTPNSLDLNVEESEVIVGVGAGACIPAIQGIIKELAASLKGCIGGTRIAVDLGFIPYERQIGSSAHNVSPKLYFACGISGASHHTAGLREAQTIVAINQDESAPIMRIAQLGAVGRCEVILPELLREIRARSRTGFLET